MEITSGVWLLAAAVVGAGWLILRRSLRRRRNEEFDAGGVSQSWLTEHKAGKGDRFS
jgi:hypothetical protein